MREYPQSDFFRTDAVRNGNGPLRVRNGDLNGWKWGCYAISGVTY